MKQKNERVIGAKKAASLREAGYSSADLHLHTYFSYDVLASKGLSPGALYEKARSRGLDYVTFTDHDTMNAYDDIGWSLPGLVPGVEISINDPKKVGHTIHINIYCLNKRQFIELEDIAKKERDIDKFLNYLQDNSLPHIYNHPFWFEAGEQPCLASIPELIKRFPVTEYNMHRIRRKNELVLELAEKYGKGIVATTDSHSGMVGKAYTLAKGDDFREFFENIRLGKSYLVARSLTHETVKDEISKWVDIISGLREDSSNKSRFTGIAGLDSLIKLFSSDLKDYPRIRALAAAAFKLISYSGIPSSLYIRSEKRHVPEIEQIVAFA